jgi:hypothetical protein
MNVIEYDHVIEKLFSTAFDPAFCNSILPRACGACAYGLHAAGCEQIGHVLAELAISIENHVAVSKRFAKGLPELLHNPRASRMFCHIKIENSAPAVFDDEETVQNSEVEGRHGEEIHGRDDLSMIAQKDSPKLAGVHGRRQTPEIP